MGESRDVLERQWLGVAAFIYGTLVAAAFSFLFYQRQGVVDPIVDLNGFGGIARSIAEGDGFSLGYGPTTRRGPLFPFLGAALIKLFGTNTPGAPETVLYRPLLIANCIFVGLTCTAVWRLARALFGSPTALLAALMCPLVPQSLRYVGMTEVETLMGLITVLLALTGFTLVQRPSIASGLRFGLVAAAGTLVKPIVQLYPFVFVALALWHWHRTGVLKHSVLKRSALYAVAAAIGCFLLLLVPWTVRNMVVTNGQFKGLSSNGPGEFLRGYINAQPKYYLLRQDFGGGGDGEKWDPEANLYEEALLRAHGVAFYRTDRDEHGKPILVPEPPKGVTSAMLELEKDHIESAEMKRRVLEHPMEFAHKFVVQLGTFWYIVETRKKALFVGGTAALVLLLSALGCWRAKRIGVSVWPVVAVIVYFNVIYAAFLALARYSMPLFPTLTVLAAGGVASILAPVWRRFGRARPSQHHGSSRVT